MSTPLPLETQTLYAELLEHLLAVQAQRSVGSLGGSVVKKQLSRETYLYWQASQPGGRTKQFYLGRETPALQALVTRFGQAQEEMAPDMERVDRLAAQLRAGGVNLTDGPSARVIRSLADSGIFAAGAVVVGTHAFVALGNALGVRWASGSLRTQDVDLASHETDIDVAVPEVEADVPSVLDSLRMGFLPVPPLDPRHPSTSFKVRGQALRVDLLCPARAPDARPVFIRRWNAAAQPLVFLDYLLEAPERAAIINGGAALINVPAPARFALHKLLLVPLRPAAFQSRAEKDLAQARTMLSFLAEARPGDLAIAWQALIGRGSRWARAGREALSLLRRRAPAEAAKVIPLLGHQEAAGTRTVPAKGKKKPGARTTRS